MPYARPPGDMLEIGPGPAHARAAGGPRRLSAPAASRPARSSRTTCGKKGFEVTEAFTPPIPPGDDRSADVRPLRRSGAGAHVRHRRGARLRRRSEAHSPAGRRVLRGRARLFEGTCVLLGRRLHATSSPPSAPASSCSMTAASRSKRSSAASASPPASRATCWRRRAARSICRASTRCRATRRPRTCCSRCEKTCLETLTFVAHAASLIVRSVARSSFD